MVIRNRNRVDYFSNRGNEEHEFSLLVASPAVKAMQDKLYHFWLSWLEKLGTFLIFFLITLILASCGRPEPPRNGGMRGDNFNHNEKVVFYCDENYQLVGESEITCKDGSWSDSYPTCVGTLPSLCFTLFFF